MSVTPVTFPPGRAMLATPTVPTPSPLTAMTIGRVEVFRLAATSAGPIMTTKMSTLLSISSWARPSSRSLRPSAHRSSNWMFLPSA